MTYLLRRFSEHRLDWNSTTTHSKAKCQPGKVETEGRGVWLQVVEEARERIFYSLGFCALVPAYACMYEYV